MRSFLYPFGFRPKPVDPNAPRYGGIYARAVAAVIDVLLVVVVFEWLFTQMHDQFLRLVDLEKLSTVSNEMTVSELMQLYHEAGFFHYWLGNALAQFSVIGVILILFQCVYQTTPGKWLLGLRIVRRGSLTQSPLRIVYVWRYLAYLISCAPLMLGYFWGGFNRERRTWHDMLAGTVVIDTRPAGWAWQKFKQGLCWLKSTLFR